MPRCAEEAARANSVTSSRDSGAFGEGNNLCQRAIGIVFPAGAGIHSSRDQQDRSHRPLGRSR